MQCEHESSSVTEPRARWPYARIPAHTLLDRQVVVLGIRTRPKSSNVKSKPWARHVLDEAAARQEIEDIGPADAEVRDEESAEPCECAPAPYR